MHEHTCTYMGVNRKRNIFTVLNLAAMYTVLRIAGQSLGNVLSIIQYVSMVSMCTYTVQYMFTLFTNTLFNISVRVQ